MTELFSTNGNCKLPCWWGINPGDPIQDVFNISSILGKEIQVSQGVYIFSLSLNPFEDLHYLKLYFYPGQQNLVERIEVRLREPVGLQDYYDVIDQNLSVYGILNHYGQPTNILLFIKPRIEKDSPIMYYLTVIYASGGFSIDYDGVVDSEDPLQICAITDWHMRNITLHMQDSQAMLQRREQLLADGYRLIGEVTNMDADAFFNAFSQPDNRECIETPGEFWQ